MRCAALALLLAVAGCGGVEECEDFGDIFGSYAATWAEEPDPAVPNHALCPSSDAFLGSVDLQPRVPLSQGVLALASPNSPVCAGHDEQGLVSCAHYRDMHCVEGSEHVRFERSGSDMVAYVEVTLSPQNLPCHYVVELVPQGG